MDTQTTRRQLLRHGLLIVLLALAFGGLVQAMTNPRMALSAHVGGIMTGMLVALVGLLWTELRLSDGLARTARWLTLYAGWANFVALVFAAALGTSAMTPIAGAGHAAGPAAEALVNLGFTTGAATILAAAALVVWGLRGQA